VCYLILCNYYKPLSSYKILQQAKQLVNMPMRKRKKWIYVYANCKSLAGVERHRPSCNEIVDVREGRTKKTNKEKEKKTQV